MKGLAEDRPEITIRPIRREDKGLLVVGLTRLSAQSAYRRFLGPKRQFTLAELRYLTEIDFTDHYALVAVAADDPSRLIAVGRWVRSSEDPQAAEVAVVVGDPWQRRGVGSEIGFALADAARARGVRRFTATMLAENEPAHRLFAKLSERLEVAYLGPVTELAAPLAAA
jgi:RimJ/RimL family protein N-acetyltransferase